MAEHVTTTQSIGVFSVSPSGTLAYRAGAETGNYQLTWFDQEGKLLNTFGNPGPDQEIAVSPDAARGVVRDASDAGAGISGRSTLHAACAPVSRFAKAPGPVGVWSPDGGRIVFAADSPGHAV